MPRQFGRGHGAVARILGAAAPIHTSPGRLWPGHNFAAPCLALQCPQSPQLDAIVPSVNFSIVPRCQGVPSRLCDCDFLVQNLNSSPNFPLLISTFVAYKQVILGLNRGSFYQFSSHLWREKKKPKRRGFLGDLREVEDSSPTSRSSSLFSSLFPKLLVLIMDYISCLILQLCSARFLLS